MFRKAGITIAVLILSIFLGCMLLGLVYCIPQQAIEPQVKNAAMIIREEGGYPEISPYATSTLDNWTDSIMLMEAAFPTEGSPLKNAMLVQRYGADSYPYGSGSVPYEEFPHYYETGEYEQVIDYPNYWHGYLVFLKPLLAVMEFREIRVLNGIVQTVLTFVICLLLWRKKAFLVFPYLLCVGLLMPAATAKCMQFSSCFYLFSLSCLAILLLDARTHLHWLLFLCSGIATAYFDFLTYPLAVFGMPALLCLFLEKEGAPLSGIKKILGFLLAWVLGYGLMWLGKLAAGSIILGQNLFIESMDHVNYWVSDWDYSIGHAFYSCISNFARTPVMILAVVYLLFMAVQLLIACKKGTLELKCFLHRSLPFLIPAVLPFVYYAIMLNPTVTHGGLFGHKALIVTSFAGLGFLAQETARIRNKKNT